MIDEKKLIEGIETIFFGFVVDDNLSIRDKLLEYINSQPTAYDVDKVVEQLRTKSFCGDFGGNYIDIDEAIEIVKGGGQG